MTILAFTDDKDGYYQYESADGMAPAWFANMTPCPVRPAPAPQVPRRVTRFQAKASLFGAGLLEQVDAYMALPDTPMVTKLAWTETQDFERESPTVAGLSALLELTSEQVDALFTTASGITA